MAYTSACNICLAGKTKLLNICNIKFRSSYNLVQALAGAQYKLSRSHLLICAKCHMILRKITDFQMQIRKTQKHIVDSLLQRSKSQSAAKSLTASSKTSTRKSLSDYNDSSINHKFKSVVTEQSGSRVVLKLEKISQENDEQQDDDSIEPPGCGTVDSDSDHDNSNDHDLANAEDDSTAKVEEIDLEDNLYAERSHLPKKRLDSFTDQESEQNDKPDFILSNEIVMPVIKDIQERFINNVKCCICDYTANTRRALISHMMIDHEKLSNEWCKVCNKLEGEDHKCSNSWDCKFCKLPCNDPVRLADHLYLHSTSPIRKNAKVKKSQESSSDIPNQSSTSKKRYMCRRCKSVFDSEALVRGHKCPKSVRICPYCQQQFNNQERYKLHLRTHIGEPRYKCRHCGKAMAQKHMLIDHERIHTGERPHVCQFCGKAFTQSSTLSTHVKLHLGRSIECTMCDKRYTRDVDLRNHVQRAHLGEKPANNLLCNLCGYATHNQYSLNRHMETHSEERKYQCKLCPKSFKQKGILKKHLLTHSDEKPHKCPVCPYRCTLKSNLKQHARKHANEAARSAAKFGGDGEMGDTFSCDHCGRHLLTEQLLLEHIRSTHAKLD